MSLFTESGTRVTKSSVTTTPDTDPFVTITEDLYETRLSSSGDGKPEGSIRTLFCKAPYTLRQSQVDALFSSPEVGGLTPNSGAATGNEVVTIEGRDLDGVTAVTFGGTAGTALTIVSNFEATVTTPAHAAGTVDVVLTGDTGDVTLTGGYTFV